MATDGANGYDAVVIGGGHNGLVAADVPGQGRLAHGRARAARDARRRDDHLGAGARHPRPDPCPHRRPAPAVGRPRPRPQASWTVAGRARRARLRAEPRRQGDRPVGRTGPHRRGPAHDIGRRRGPLRRLRPPRPFAGRLPRRDRQPDPARHRIARSDRCAGRAQAWPDVPRAGASRRPDDHPRPADGRRRLRGRIVRDRRASGRDRLAWHPVHRDGPLVGRHDRGAARRFGRQRRGSGRPDGVRAGRAGRAGQGARIGGARGRRRDPDRCRGRGDHLARRPGDRRGAGRWRRAERPCGRRRDRPEAHPDEARRPGRDRAQPALASRQHPDAGHGVEGQSRAVGAAVVHRRRRRPAAGARADRHRSRHRRHGTGPRRCQVRPAVRHADHGGHDPVAGRPHARRRSARWQPGHERHRGRHAAALRDGSWDERRETLGDRVVAALDAHAPGLAAWSPHGRSSPRSTSSATTA